MLGALLVLALVPCEVPFECVEGLRLRNAEVSWRMTSDAGHQALYDFVHVTFTYTAGPQAGIRQEFTATMSFPNGAPAAYRISRLTRVRWIRTLWLTKHPVWRPLKRGSSDYNDACNTMMRVFMVANLLRRGTDPATVEF